MHHDHFVLCYYYYLSVPFMPPCDKLFTPLLVISQRCHNIILRCHFTTTFHNVVTTFKKLSIMTSLQRCVHNVVTPLCPQSCYHIVQCCVHNVVTMLCHNGVTLLCPQRCVYDVVPQRCNNVVSILLCHNVVTMLCP